MSSKHNSGSSRKADDSVKSGTRDKSSDVRDGQPQASGGASSSSSPPPTIEPDSQRQPVVRQQQHTTTGGPQNPPPSPLQAHSQAATVAAGQNGLGVVEAVSATPSGKQAAADNDGGSGGTSPRRPLPRPSSDEARDARHARVQPAKKEPARRTMTGVNLSKAQAVPSSGQQRSPAPGGPRLGHELRSSASLSAVARNGRGGANSSGGGSSSSGSHVARSQQPKREPERRREQPSSKKLQRAQTQRNSVQASKSASIKSKNDVAAGKSLLPANLTVSPSQTRNLSQSPNSSSSLSIINTITSTNLFKTVIRTAGKAFTTAKTKLNLINKSTMVDQAVIDKLEAGFAKLQASTPEQCHSLLKKYLTREVLDNNKTKKTAMGASLLDVAQSGFENLDSGVGIYAPDAESYTLFADLFNPIIEDYHGGFKATDKHPQSDFGDISTLVNVDPTNEFVISTRVRCGRSLQGYPFNPCLTEAQYKEMESKVSSTLKEMSGDLAGTYYPLTGMTKETQQQLIDDHFLFKEGDRFLQAANACRYWPTGRGIYHNTEKTFLVWVNEEDHLRIISMQKGGDLKTIYDRLVRGAKAIESKVPFSRDNRLGFLTFCPTNLGTTIRASVHIKLPKLAADRKKLEEVAGRYNLQVRGTSGEHTESVGGVYDISNKRRLGLTEYQAVREMQDGILELIKIEKSL